MNSMAKKKWNDWVVDLSRIKGIAIMSARILAQLMSTVKNALEEHVTLNGTRYW